MSTKKKVLLKIVIVGDSGVGKTAVLQRYVSNKFIEEHKATIGADFMTQEIRNKNEIIILQMWDTAGQERFHSLGSTFYRGVDACILVYDITNTQSFTNIDTWRTNFLISSSPNNADNFPFLLLGNKCDLGHDREVTIETGNRYAQKYNMKFYETSALNGQMVKDSIETIANIASEMSNVPYLSDQLAQQIVKLTANENENENDECDGNESNNVSSQCACSLI